MDYTDLVETFWNNVSLLKEQRKMTWKDVAANTGHTGASLSALKNGHKMPSMGIARSIARSLGTTIEALCSDADIPDGGDDRSLRRVLYEATAGLDESNILNLIFFAEDMAANQAKEPAKEDARSILAFDSKMGMTTLGGMIESLTEKYLGPKKAETDGENDRK